MYECPAPALPSRVPSPLPPPSAPVCGRDSGLHHHPGNVSFRELVNEVKFHHVHCPKRKKTLLTRHIVEAVRHQTTPGRFLAKASATGLWHDVGDGNARKKTSQVLRDVSGRRADAAAPSRRR